MEEWQKRVFNERDDLQEKIDKLEAFFKSDRIHDVSNEHDDLLKRQLSAMSLYRDILNERIALFKK